MRSAYVRNYTTGSLCRVILKSADKVSLRQVTTGRVHWVGRMAFLVHWEQMKETAPGIFQPIVGVL